MAAALSQDILAVGINVKQKKKKQPTIILLLLPMIQCRVELQSN